MEPSFPTALEDFTDARVTNALAELYDALESRPRDINLHKMLIQGWVSLGESGKQMFIS